MRDDPGFKLRLAFISEFRKYSERLFKTGFYSNAASIYSSYVITQCHNNFGYM